MPDQQWVLSLCVVKQAMGTQSASGMAEQMLAAWHKDDAQGILPEIQPLKMTTSSLPKSAA